MEYFVIGLVSGLLLSAAAYFLFRGRNCVGDLRMVQDEGHIYLYLEMNEGETIKDWGKYIMMRVVPAGNKSRRAQAL